MTASRTFAASEETVPEMIDYVSAITEGLSPKVAYELNLASEEILVNIASYAYPDGEGELAILWENDEQARRITLCFEDFGVSFNPLLMETPDLDAPIAERKIGGLGIMMVRKLMDDVQYARVGDKNRLTISKAY